MDMYFERLGSGLAGVPQAGGAPATPAVSATYVKTPGVGGHIRMMYLNPNHQLAPRPPHSLPVAPAEPTGAASSANVPGLPCLPPLVSGNALRALPPLPGQEHRG